MAATSRQVLAGESDGTQEGFRQGLASLLVHPDFLYVRDVPMGQSANLEPFSIANRVSFALTGHGPDDQLFNAARDGSLARPVIEYPATGATYLDNTMVLITTEHDGRPNGHLRGAVSSIVVGGFGSFTGGKSFDFSTPALAQEEASCIYQGVSYSRLLYSVLGAFGASAATMGIQGIAQDWQGADMAEWNRPLTGLL